MTDRLHRMNLPYRGGDSFEEVTVAEVIEWLRDQDALTEGSPHCLCGSWLSHLCDCPVATTRLVSEPWRIDREGNRI